jgi:hypothetical protein
MSMDFDHTITLLTFACTIWIILKPRWKRYLDEEEEEKLREFVVRKGGGNADVSPEELQARRRSFERGDIEDNGGNGFYVSSEFLNRMLALYGRDWWRSK